MEEGMEWGIRLGSIRNIKEKRIGATTLTILLRNIKKNLRCCRISIAGKGDFIRIFPSVKRICALHLKPHTKNPTPSVFLAFSSSGGFWLILWFMIFVRFVVLTTIVKRWQDSWIWCRISEGYENFGGAWCLHLQSRWHILKMEAGSSFRL